MDHRKITCSKALFSSQPDVSIRYAINHCHSRHVDWCLKAMDHIDMEDQLVQRLIFYLVFRTSSNGSSK